MLNPPEAPGAYGTAPDDSASFNRVIVDGGTHPADRRGIDTNSDSEIRQEAPSVINYEDEDVLDVFTHLGSD